jgi:hypothetical protein
MDIRELITQRLIRGVNRRLNNLRISQMARQVARRAPTPAGQPVVFLKASTGIDDLSWNSGFHLLASWGLRLRGIPIVYFACDAGMSRCVLGTRRDDVYQLPPCASCVYQSRTLYTSVPRSTASNDGSRAYWFKFDRQADLEHALAGLSLDELSRFTWEGTAESGAGQQAVPGKRHPPIIGSNNQTSTEQATSAPVNLVIPLGELCLPGLRWILRRHNLADDESTRFLLREYILSAWNVAQKFSACLDQTRPRAVVVFNGQFFPEATARFVAQRRGVRVITHEVGLQPASAFFTEGEATAYPIHLPGDFQLSVDQNARLDAYLQRRFHGDFSMAGIQFWPRMRGLDQVFLARASRFKQIVPVFTNVIFDTSQPHANTVFTDMFAWLDLVLAVAKSQPETQFIVRAHPDETRRRKESRETVQDWFEDRRASQGGNLVFVGPDEHLSSYELIQRSKFVLVYNSTIGLEATIMGKPVLCGGNARYTQYATVFFPQSVSEQRSKMEEFLAAEEIHIPAEFADNARRFLYYQLFRTSLPFGDFLRPSVRKTQTRLKAFDLEDLMSSEAIEAISEGILQGGDFLMRDRQSPG